MASSEVRDHGEKEIDRRGKAMLWMHCHLVWGFLLSNCVFRGILDKQTIDIGNINHD